MIPNLITDTLVPIAGEFANSAGPFMSPINFNITGIPSDLLSLPSGIELPKMNEFQASMLKTMLTSGGRLELFKNPMTDAIGSCKSKLLNLGEGIDIDLQTAATDLAQTLDYFKEHTDRLSGVIEPTSSTAKYPSLEKALAVGESLDHMHQMLDDAAPTNAPALSLFSSMFAGKDKLAKLQEMLSNPSSSFSAAELSGISSFLTTTIESDVTNYTVGLKKLQRIGVASIAFGGRDKQVSGFLLKNLIATPNTVALFGAATAAADSATQAVVDAAAAAQEKARGPGEAFTRDFKNVEDLIKFNGLYDGLPLTTEVWNHLKSLYPPDQPGILNAALKGIAYPGPGESLLETIYLDWASRQNFTVAAIDPYFFGFKKLGSISAKLMLIMGKLSNAISGTFVGWKTFDGAGKEVIVTNEAAILSALYTSAKPPYTHLVFEFCGVQLSYDTYKAKYMRPTPPKPTTPPVTPPVPSNVQMMGDFGVAGSPMILDGQQGITYCWKLPKTPSGAGIIVHTATTITPGELQVEWAISPTPGDFGYYHSAPASVVSGRRGNPSAVYYPCGSITGWESGGVKWNAAGGTAQCKVPTGEQWYVNLRFVSGTRDGKAQIYRAWQIQ